MSNKKVIGLAALGHIKGKTMRTTLALCLLLFALATGCERDVSGNVARAQMSVCEADIEKQLNDPSSLEVVSSKTAERTDGTYLLIVDFTARNAFGGRIRKSTSCGFKTKLHTELNPDEFQNQLRSMGTFN